MTLLQTKRIREITWWTIENKLRTYSDKCDMNTDFLIGYLIVIGITGIFLVWWLRKKVSSVEDQRVSRLAKITRFDAVRTSSPFRNPFKKAKERAQERIEHRFSVIKHAAMFLIFTLWGIGLIFPFLHSIPATLISLIMAMFTVFIGIAAKPYIENMISGIVISFSQHLRVGDTVILDDHYGTVEDISLTHTIIKQWDWQRYIIPNSRMLTKEMLNLTLYDPFVWAYVEFWVDYNADLQQVQDIAVSVMSANIYFANYEPPQFWVMDMSQQGLRCWIAGWTNSPVDAWMLKVETRSALVKAFQEAGIPTHCYQLHVTETTTD